MAYETIHFTVDDGLAFLTLNRPDSLNAFNDTMIAETMDALKNCGRDPAIRAVILSGNGRGFSSGQDLRAMDDREASVSLGEHLRQGYNRLIGQMADLEKPIVGAINGIAAGAGCGVALATDIRIAADSASFMLAFSRVGLIPDSGANWVLPRLIGYARAYQMAVTAEKVSAERALAWGLVNEVVPSAQLPEVAEAWGRKLAAGPTRAFGLTKRAMQRAQEMNLRAALDYEAHLQEIAGRTSDHQEGVQAFLEKRAATFSGA